MTADGSDRLIGVGTKRPDGTFDVAVAPPLRAGQRVYAVDRCFAPPLVGPTVLVVAKVPAPLLDSGGGLMALLLLWVVRAALAACVRG